MRVTRMGTTDLKRVRSDFPALENYTWFQNGGVSITPRPVAEFHAGLMDELLQRGPMHIVYPDEEYPRRKRSLDRLAEFFGVSSSPLAVMRGGTHAAGRLQPCHDRSWLPVAGRGTVRDCPAARGDELCGHGSLVRGVAD